MNKLTQKKFDYLNDTKDLIRDAIVSKGVEVSANATFRSYAEKIAAINGDYSDVHFVTFMSEDGTTELYKRAVVDGDDCADPVIRGLISEPPKESTVNYNYTLVGWSATPNGALDENILKAVTTDKTVYANYAAVLRHYTVTYYDEDGTTVLKTESLAYGTMPSYTPEKQDFAFAGWTPSLATVTGNVSYTASWTSVITFANASWSQIAEISASGEAPTKFAVGDTKTLTLTFSDTTETIKVRIIGFNHDDLADGSGKAGISIASAQALTTGILTAMEGSYAIWQNSNTRTAFNSGTLYKALPPELKTNLKSVTKTSNGGYSKDCAGYEKNALYTTTDKVWMLSSTELGLDNVVNASFTAKNQGENYAYYTNNASRVIKTTANKNRVYPTRSMNTKYLSDWVAVSSSGDLTSGVPGKSGTKTYQPSVFGFCI